MHGLIHRRNPVFGEEKDFYVTGFVVVNKSGDSPVDGQDFRGDIGSCGAIFLKAVVEVWKINEREGGGVPFLHPFGGGGDPFGRCDACGWPPEGWEGKRAKIRL